MKPYDLALELLTRHPSPGLKRSLHRYCELTEIINSKTSANSDILDLGSGGGFLSALLSRSGHSVTAVDNLEDPTVRARDDYDSFKKRLACFLSESGVEFVDESLFTFRTERKYDFVILNDVVEHLDDPRSALNNAISFLKPGGKLMVGFPSSVALLKRAKCLFGKTIYPPVEEFFFTVGKYPGHIREYTPAEAKILLKYAGLVDVTVECRNFYTRESINHARGHLKAVYGLYGLFSNAVPNFRDSILVFGVKPETWIPIADDFPQVQRIFKRLYKLKGWDQP